MKTHDGLKMKKELKLTSLLMMLVLVSACSKESVKTQENPSTASQPIPSYTPVFIPTPPPSDYSGTVNSGSSVPLIVNPALFREFFYENPPASYDNVRISINVRNLTSAIIVSYHDGRDPVNVFRSAHFHSRLSTGTSDTSLNKWYTIGGQPVYKAIYQDDYGTGQTYVPGIGWTYGVVTIGAVIIVIDQFIGTGDGQPPELVGGSIWFQNFNRNSPANPFQGPNKMCWQVTLGPYDCRTNISGGFGSAVDPSGKGPNAANLYQKLGVFSNLSRTAAGI